MRRSTSESPQHSAQCPAHGMGLHLSTREESEIPPLHINHHGIKLDRRFIVKDGFSSQEGTKRALKAVPCSI